MLAFLSIHVCCGFSSLRKSSSAWLWCGSSPPKADWAMSMVPATVSSTCFGSVPWFLFFPRIMLGLDLFPVRCLSGLFCFLSDSYVGGGWGRVAVVVRVVHDDGVICRGISTSDVFFDVFFCVGVCILCELHCTVHAHIVSGSTGTIALDVVAGVWMIVLTRQGDSDGRGVEWNCLVRLLLHLPICTACCSSVFDPPYGLVACRMGLANEATSV